MRGYASLCANTGHDHRAPAATGEARQSRCLDKARLIACPTYHYYTIAASYYTHTCTGIRSLNLGH